MTIDHHGRADKTHCPHANTVAEILQLIFERGDLLVGIAVADSAQTGRLLTQLHTGVFRAADADTYDRGLTGKAALAEGNQRIKQEPLDAINAVTGKQHAVIGTEQPSLMHGGDIDPVCIRLKAPVDFRH